MVTKALFKGGLHRSTTDRINNAIPRLKDRKSRDGGYLATLKIFLNV